MLALGDACSTLAVKGEIQYWPSAAEEAQHLEP